jgi:molybdopterin synthase catalytic subunit
MRVRVLFFGVLKDLVGKSAESLDLPPGATVSDLLAHYAGVPRMTDLLPSLAISVNQEYAPTDAPLREQDEVGLLPPVSGGSTAHSSVPPLPVTRARLVHAAIDLEQISAAIKQPSDGAVVIFEGIVRNHSRGRGTLFLEYEAYEPMASKELEKLAAEAGNRFSVREVVVVHRLGHLEIGETSVLIAVAAAHRGPAFEACRWVIDSLKQTVPIWKKEYFVDGAVWAPGEPFPSEVRNISFQSASAKAGSPDIAPGDEVHGPKTEDRR